MELASDEILHPFDGHPVGEEPYGTEEFENLAEIIGTLDGLDRVEIDWERLGNKAEGILIKTGKDLRTANYLVFANFKINGFAGLAKGLALLDALVNSDYGDLLFPVRRKRQEKARAAPFLWLSTKLEKHFSMLELESFTEFDNADDAYRNFRQLSLSLRDYLKEDAPAFSELNVTLKRFADEALRVKAEKEELSARTKETRPNVEQSSNAEASSVSAPVVTPKPTPPPAPVSVNPGAISSSGDVTKNLSAAGSIIQKVANYLKDMNPNDPEYFFLNRISKWILITELPQSGLLPQQPGPDILSKLEQLESGKQFNELLSQSESLFEKGAIFCLALHRFVFNSLRGMGQELAAKVVLATTLNFLERFPDTFNRTFSNGEPFIDAKTRFWIESVTAGAVQSSPGVADNAGNDNSSKEDINNKIKKYLAEGKTSDALNLIEKSIRLASSLRESALWRIEQIKVLLAGSFNDIAILNAEKLHTELSLYKIDVWEPELYKEVLILMLEIHKKIAVKVKYDADKLKLISSLKKELTNISASEAIKYSDFAK